MTAYLLHFALASTEALTVRCLVGRCRHRHHRIMAYLMISVLTTIATVHLVG